jgi:hypothetical protein
MVLVLLSSLGAGLAGSSAHANTFTYDFENLTVGALVGQDGWAQLSTWFSPGVTGGGGFNPTQVSAVQNAAQGNATGAIRSLESPLLYTAADTAVLWQFDGLVLGTDVSQTALLGLGSNLFGRQGTRTLLIVSGSPLSGDTLLPDDWYRYRLELDFSIPGVNSTLFYRNLSKGEALFTKDGVLQDVNLGITPNEFGEYEFTRLFIRQDTNVGGTYIDDIRIAPVPEPGSLALVGAGVVAITAMGRRRPGLIANPKRGFGRCQDRVPCEGSRRPS